MLSALLSATSVMAQNATLEWELVNPFRFIRHQESIDKLRSIYKGLSAEQKTAQGLERRLQELSEIDIDIRRGEAKFLNCDDPKWKREKKRCLKRRFESYPGWFARLAEDDYKKTCWNPKTRRFRTDEDGCRDYINPESYKVRVWIENPQLLGNRVPTWFKDNQPLTESKSIYDPKTEYKNCDAKHEKAFCIEFTVFNPPKINVSSRLSDGSMLTFSEPAEVVDKLIVGLGDSYAAGEGNPDIPAQFTQGRKERDFLPDLLKLDIPAAIKGTRRPRRDEGKEAEARWLDKRCHRSMYSYQFKTALQLALSNPRQAITYVSYSCSGATTDEIFKTKAKAIEGGGRVEVQLDSLREVLSNGNREMREIDYLLLSTGGNDIKFGPLVAYAMLSGKSLNIYERMRKKGVNADKIIKSYREKEFATTLLGKEKRDGNYFDLKKALLDAPLETKSKKSKEVKPDESKRIRIKNCDPNGLCKNILLTPYPNILNNEDSKPCRADRKEFDNPFGEDKRRAERLKLLNDNVVLQIQEVQKDPIIISESGLGWTVVSANAEAYSNNGFCARIKTDPRPLPVAENFELPRWKSSGWESFDPREYRSYATRHRWIRIPVDAKLTTDQLHTILGRFEVDLFLEDDRAMIMHPTAEGLAKTADTNLEEIKKLESKANEQPRIFPKAQGR